MYGVESWELIGRSDDGDYHLPLSEEQIYAIFKVLGLEIKELSEEKYLVMWHNDEHLKSLKTEKE